MTDPAYPAARIAAPIIQDHFVRRVAAHESDALRLRLPDADAVEGIIDAAFWASLRREEGYLPKISLVYLRPDQTVSPMTFERSLPLDATTLTKLAPAVERPGIHLGVWRDRNQLRIWGTTRHVPTFGFVLEVISPGLLVVKHRRTEGGKFANVLVLDGDQIKIVDERASSLPDCPPLLTSLLGFDVPSTWADTMNVLVELAVSMRRHGRGGSLLVVPGDGDGWRESIVHPIPYPVMPAFSELADLVREDVEEARQHGWRDEIERAVDAIAGLTAVDGATVITRKFDLLAFGAKIARRDGRQRIEEVIVTEPIEGSSAATIHPAQLGGTRHLSAAQFVRDQQDSVALVASQDGRFTIFSWSPCEEMVHAHHVESLLL
jgi:hypothetical protein